MSKVSKTLNYISMLILLLGIFVLKNRVEKLEKDNAYMVEQVKKLDGNVLVIEGVLEDQHIINDELVNRLGNYADNVKVVNELLSKLKGE